jgi:hypothetical protein
MSSEISSRSLFMQIVDHALKSLENSPEFNEGLLSRVRDLAQKEGLTKPAGLLKVFKPDPEDKQ